MKVLTNLFSSPPPWFRYSRISYKLLFSGIQLRLLLVSKVITDQLFTMIIKPSSKLLPFFRAELEQSRFNLIHAHTTKVASFCGFSRKIAQRVHLLKKLLDHRFEQLELRDGFREMATI